MATNHAKFAAVFAEHAERAFTLATECRALGMMALAAYSDLRGVKLLLRAEDQYEAARYEYEAQWRAAR